MFHNCSTIRLRNSRNKKEAIAEPQNEAVPGTRPTRKDPRPKSDHANHSLRSRPQMQADPLLMEGVSPVPSLGPLPVVGQETDASAAGLLLSPNGSSSEEVRTLFLRGLPADVKEREIHNLFRLVQGYDYSTLRVGTNAQPVAFVTFKEQSSALVARDLLQGIRFDPRSPVLLRIELARSNSKTKKSSSQLVDGAEIPLRLTPRSDGDVLGPVSPRLVSPRPIHGGSLSAPSGLTLSSTSATSPRRAVPPLLGSSSSYAGAFGFVAESTQTGTGTSPPSTPSPRSALSRLNQAGSQAGPQAPQTPTAGSAPCSTLYVKNLALATTEQDALALFRTQQGFRKLKLQTKPTGALMLFVEFVDSNYSTVAMQNLQGVALNGCTIRIEYARHKMGESSNNSNGSNMLLSSSSGTIIPAGNSPRGNTPPAGTTSSANGDANGGGESLPAPQISPRGSSAPAAVPAGGFVVHPPQQHHHFV